MKIFNVSLLCAFVVASAYASDNGQSDAGPALPRAVVRQPQPAQQPAQQAQSQQRPSDPSAVEYNALAQGPATPPAKNQDTSNCVIL